MTTKLTLKQIALNHMSDTSIQSKEALIAQFLQFKEVAHAKYNSVLSETLPMQQSLRKTLLNKYRVSLFEYAQKCGVLGQVFPRIDLSFLARHSEYLPQWALFDVNGPDTFEILISFRLASTAHSCSGRINPESFSWLYGSTYRNPHFEDWIPSELQLRHRLEQFVKTEFADNKPFHLQTETGEKTLTLKGQANEKSPLWCSTPCLIRISLKSTFNHFVPQDITALINDFRDCFERVFFISEVTQWETNVLSVERETRPSPNFTLAPATNRLPAGDPLVIGERRGQYYLLGDFDLTDAESYIRQEFTF